MNDLKVDLGLWQRKKMEEGRRICTHHDLDIHVHFLSYLVDYTEHLDQFSSELSRAVIYFPSEIMGN